MPNKGQVKEKCRSEWKAIKMINSRQIATKPLLV